MKYFEIGKVVNTYGVKGEVKVIPTTFDVKRFELLDKLELFMDDEVSVFTIERVWYHKQFVIIKFKEIGDMTSAEKLKGRVIKVTEDKALPLGEDEYYINDLYGMEVKTCEGEYLGKIIEILFTGANDVYIVKEDEKKELLIPAIKKCINKVDVKNNEMTVTLLEGLR